MLSRQEKKFILTSLIHQYKGRGSPSDMHLEIEQISLRISPILPFTKSHPSSFYNR